MLKVDLPDERLSYTCEIVDLMGKIHFKKESVNGQKTEIDTNNLQPGLYFLKAASGIHTYSKPFIIN